MLALTDAQGWTILGVVAVCSIALGIVAVHVYRRGGELMEQAETLFDRPAGERPQSWECDQCLAPPIVITSFGRWCGIHIPDDDPRVTLIIDAVRRAEEMGE